MEAEFASSQDQFDEIGRIHSAGTGALTSHDEMHFVDEQDDVFSLFGGFFDFIKNRFDPLFELALVACTGLNGAQVQRE
ncbi:hypothetical protein PGT21_025757 [Puccinia graminis f. sp. tritici]|uniref:Uncharacterized protein n=1 Tax=Puccinia graminis f. sp. tritici TaxID=56615 RepID=A0A5B0NLI6_PUCGR|nr:hypothetical protein PGT21_025757 [Puccinia graminis f. sp. tritici]